MRTYFLIFLSAFIVFPVAAQEGWNGKKTYFLEISPDGDTLPGIILPEVAIRESNLDYLRKLARYRAYVLRTLPLANYVSQLYREFSDSLTSIDKKKSQRKYLKEEKKKLFDEFTGIAWEMNLNEGRVFNKLVCRQSGKVTYDIIRELQGKFKAGCWQALSLSGGANLRLRYDPLLEDKVIEDVMKEIESGKITVPPLPHSREEFRASR